MKISLIVFFALTANVLIAQSWYDISVPTEHKLNEIDFPTPTTGYIVGDSATILKTTDGGETWNQIPLTGITINPLSSNIIDVDFVDENIGFIVFDNANEGPYKTSDGGASWILFSNGSSNMCYKKTMFVNSENDFFLGGAGCFQSGQIEYFLDPNWNYSTVNYESFDTDESVVEIDFNNGIGIAAMHNKFFLRSIDNGITWDTIPSGLDSSFKLTSVMFATADSVYAGYEDINSSGLGILRSYDAGLTWSQDANSALFLYPSFLSLGKANNGDVYCGANQSNWSQAVMFESIDGVNWIYNNVDQAINGIDSYDSDITFAVGDSGYVIVNTPIENLGTGNENEDYFHLIKVYPNPTSDFVTIESEFNKNVVYTLLNMNGQVILSAIASKNRTTIDISLLEDGIYYLKTKDHTFNTFHKIVKL